MPFMALPVYGEGLRMVDRGTGVRIVYVGADGSEDILLDIRPGNSGNLIAVFPAGVTNASGKIEIGDDGAMHCYGPGGRGVDNSYNAGLPPESPVE